MKKNNYNQKKIDKYSQFIENKTSKCTKLSNRSIQRNEYHDAVDINDNNIKQNPQYYKRRQKPSASIPPVPSNGIRLHAYIIERIRKSKWRDEFDHVLLQLYAYKKYPRLQLTAYK